MIFSSLTLRSQARSIWQAGIHAIRSEQLVQGQIRLTEDSIFFGEHQIRLDTFDRICVVGAGKAAAGLAVGLELALAPLTSGSSDESQNKPLIGWVNVPDDCLLPTRSVYLHPARPAGVNEPTVAAAAGADKILDMVSQLGPRDLCIALIAGGGSALLPAPVAGVSLDGKLAITRLLSHNGADIHQLNTVRKQLSRIKGGGLANACQAGQLVSLILSDVLGDPLDIIASGPTVADPSTPADALAVLKQFASSTAVSENAEGAKSIEEVWQYLRDASREEPVAIAPRPAANVILGNNDAALAACAKAARGLGYDTQILPTDPREPSAEMVAKRLVDKIKDIIEATARSEKKRKQPVCILSGGEPIVSLAPPELRGKGGRNQQLVLSALRQLADIHVPDQIKIAFLSAGTDGEDGPTDAAGAVLWPDLITAIASAQLQLDNYLKRNNAYPILDSLGGLVRSGPTHTNVCDVRVILLSA